MLALVLFFACFSIFKKKKKKNSFNFQKPPLKVHVFRTISYLILKNFPPKKKKKTTRNGGSLIYNSFEE
jgi:hypothetical protein